MKQRIAGILVILASVAGCKKVLDKSKVEDEIKGKFASASGVAFDKVDCPDGHSLKTGDVFTCAASAGGVNFEVEVTQVDDVGNIHMKGKDVIVATTVAKLVAGQIKDKFKVDVAVDCGKGLIALKKGQSAECSATGPDGSTKKVKATAIDDYGNVNTAVE